MRMSVFTVFLLLLALPCRATELAPFTTDGCSLFPEGTLDQQQLWLECCTAHDLAYWQGGTYEQRLNADEALQLCVAQAGEEEIAELMLAGVRVGGSPYWITTYRWGYGWPYWNGWQPRGYKALTLEERRTVEEQLQRQQATPHSQLPPVTP